MPKNLWAITRDMFLTEEEVGRLLRHLRGRVQASEGREQVGARVDELIVQALLFSGLRNSELCGLEVADTVVGTGESTFVVRARGQVDRIVYVPDHLSASVRQYVTEIRPSLLSSDIRPNDAQRPLLYNERRNGYERTGLYRRVVRTLTEAGLGERASVQLLRHTYGYLAYKFTGGNLLFTQRQLGHAHPMVTVVYAQFVNESYADLAQRVEEGACGVREDDAGRDSSRREVHDRKRRPSGTQRDHRRSTRRRTR